MSKYKQKWAMPWWLILCVSLFFCLIAGAVAVMADKSYWLGFFGAAAVSFGGIAMAWLTEPRYKVRSFVSVGCAVRFAWQDGEPIMGIITAAEVVPPGRLFITVQYHSSECFYTAFADTFTLIEVL